MGNANGSPFAFRPSGSSGSSSGSSGINYASNLFSGASLSGINTYNDGASAVPTDGTGGTATGLSTTLNTTTPLRGTSCQRFSKDGSNRQGCGWSWDFTLDRADYQASNAVVTQFVTNQSAAFVNGDIRLFVYDRDAGQLLNVSSLTGDGSVLNAGAPTLYTGVFYTNSTSNDYRLIWHIAGTTAAAWDFDMDSLTVGPDMVVPGAIITPWTAYSPTSQGFGTLGSTALYWRRNGSNLEIDGSITAGTVTASEARINFPSSSMVSLSSIASTSGAGNVLRTGVVAAALYTLKEPNVSYFTFGAQRAAEAGLNKLAGNAVCANSERFSVSASIPIQGWEASASLSTTDTMLLGAKARYTSSSGQSIPNNADTIVDFSTRTYDVLTNVATGASWRFTAQKPGYYSVKCSLLYTNTANWALTEFARLWIYKNGSQYSSPSSHIFEAATGTNINVGIVGSDTVYLNQGEYLDIRAYQVSGSALTLVADSLYNFVAIEQIIDPTIFSVYGNFQLLTTTSGTKTPAASGQFNALTNNFLDLPPGTWTLTGFASYLNSGSTPGYTIFRLGWYAANGADSGSQPALLSTLSSSLTILSAAYVSGSDQLYEETSATANKAAGSAPLTVRCTATTRVYLVSNASMSTAANARITVYANAQRVQ